MKHRWEAWHVFSSVFHLCLSVAKKLILLVRIWSNDFHEPFHIFQRTETKPRVKSVGVARPEHEPPQALQLRMREHGGDQLFAATTGALVFGDEHVREPGKRGAVGDDPREAHLRRAAIDPEAE